MTEDLKKLVQAAQAGQTEAFAKIVDRLRDMVLGFAYTLLGDFHLAEDVAQEAFVEAYHNLHKLRESEAFAGWLRQIVRFQCHRLLRRKDPPARVAGANHETSLEQSSPDHQAEKRELESLALRTVQSLSDPLREVTTLFYINGYSHQDISLFLDIPVNTVKSRLHSSRQQLSDKVIQMAKETLTTHRLGDDFTGRVLEGVPRVGFFQGGHACPESYPFCSCLAACLRHMREDRGTTEIEVQGNKWLLNQTYVYLMGVSGEAFRLFWRDNWDMGNSNILSVTSDSRRFFDGAFTGIGRGYDLLLKQDLAGDESLWRDRIVRMIRDQGRPVLAFGVVGPPECCIITGFDQGGEVLMGWSFFQEMPDFGVGIDIEPCGYFRKRHWLAETYALLFIGEKKKEMDLQTLCRQTLQHAIKLIRQPTIQLDGCWHSGLSAFSAWAEALVRHEEIPAQDMALLRQRHLAHTSTVGMVAEGRWYGSLFLPWMMECLPHTTEPLQAALGCFKKEHQLMWQIWGLVGGHGFEDDKVQKFAEPQVREQMVPLILAARDCDEQAAEYMAEALTRI